VYGNKAFLIFTLQWQCHLCNGNGTCFPVTKVAMFDEDKQRDNDNGLFHEMW